jgi:hypothetical protein
MQVGGMPAKLTSDDVFYLLHIFSGVIHRETFSAIYAFRQSGSYLTR